MTFSQSSFHKSSETDQPVISLSAFFERINERHFDGFLELIELRWNSRLRSSAGRFFPGSRKYISQVPPRIEIAAYLLEEKNAEHLVYDTLAHEMIHYWLWVRRRPYGHTPEFHHKMQQMGVSRYNPVPRLRPYRYLYGCPHCRKEFPSKKRLGVLACLHCCKSFAGGRYDARFKLVLLRALDLSEGRELLRQRTSAPV
jgi:predicted SprT family Zn-dependent metalloprotease